MAIIYRFPVLVWQDIGGMFTAQAANSENEVAIGRTSALARKNLTDFLEWRIRNYAWRYHPTDLVEAELRTLKVFVRAEYRQGERRYPCSDPILLKVPCILSRFENGLEACSAPTVGVDFYFHDQDSLADLLPHYVQEQFRGLTPRGISRYAEPPVVQLHEIVIRIAVDEGHRRTVIPPPTLTEVAESLHDRSLRKQFGAAWQRENEVRSLAQLLVEQVRPVLIVGPPGSGKTTVLVAAVRQAELLEAELRERGMLLPLDVKTRDRYWMTSAARIMSGMKYLGQWEQRCEELIAELREFRGALCIENLLDLVRQGGQDPQSSAAAFFMPFIQRRDLRLISEVTPEELDACRRLLPGFVDLFQIVKLSPMNSSEAVKVLGQYASEQQRNHKIGAEPGVPEQIVHAHERFMPYYAFPGKAAGFLAELYDNARRERQTMITREATLQHFVRRTGLNEIFLRDDAQLDVALVQAGFERRVIGQSEACRAAAQVVTTFKTGLNDPRRPIGVLLFCGPTGVGKTELAKSLADLFFGSGEQKDRLLRLDMSEYAGPGSGNRLLSKPDGSPSTIIDRLRQQPFQVVLLDEIEKASWEVFDVLMNVFDEGRISDRFGRTTSFRSTLIVMTSNLGASKTASLGLGPATPVRYADEALGFFRPEFFNRIDGIVSFSALDHATIVAITRKELLELAGREGLRSSGANLSWTEEVVEHLAAAGFDPRYGARPLQRVLEDQVVTPLAKAMIGSPTGRRGSWQLQVATVTSESGASTRRIEIRRAAH